MINNKFSIINNLVYLTKAINKLKIDKAFNKKYELIIQLVISTINQQKKIYFCGNGGSAADCNHIAAEFTGRFYKNRQPLQAESLTANISSITAIGNDYGYEFIFSRLIGDYVKPGDLIFFLSTSGKSKNIINAIDRCEKKNIQSILISNNYKNSSKKNKLLNLNLRTNLTPRTQELTMIILHSICEDVEKYFFEN